MTKLNLTPARRAIIDAAEAEYRRIGLSTEPADFNMAETAATRLYERIGRKRPYFVHLDSPMAAELYINLLVGVWPKAIENWDQLRDQLWGQLRDQLWGQLRDQLGGRLWDQLGDQLRDRLWGQLWGQLRGPLWGQLWDQLGDQLRDRLGDQLRDRLWGQLWGQLRGQLRDQLGGQLWDQLGDRLGGQLRDQLGDQLGGQLRDRLGDQLRGQLWGQLRDQLWGQLRDQLGGQLWDQLGDQLRDRLWDRLGGQLRDQLRDQLGGQLWGHKLNFMGTWFCGAWDAWLWGFYETGRRVGAVYPDVLNAALDDHCAILRSCGWFYPFADFCILTNRPDIVSFDDRGRLHADNGAAVRFRDDYRLYAIHGRRVDGWLVESPELITVEKIDAEQNVEIKRVMIEHYKTGDFVSGAAAFLRDAGAELLDHDDTHGRLLCRRIDGDEPIVMVEVLNPTPEPEGPLSEVESRQIFGDGAVDRAILNFTRSATWRPCSEPRFKAYYLRVHPELRPMKAGRVVGAPQKMTALNAVASTWGLTGAEFAPEFRA